MKEDIRVIRLRKAFRDSGLTQKEVCDRTGITPGAMSSYLSGRYFPKQRALDELSRVLNVPLLYLMGRPIPEEDEDPAALLPSNAIPLAHAHVIPILGTICAGDGVICDEHYEGSFSIDASVHADYAIRVKGDSMTGSGIRDGDLAFIRKDFDFREGGIYAVVTSGTDEAFLKIINTHDNLLILTPSNPSYTVLTKEEDEVCIVGELVGVYHPCD